MEAMWTPRKLEVEQSNLYKFQYVIQVKYLQKFSDYQSFHQFSVKKKDVFWRELVPIL